MKRKKAEADLAKFIHGLGWDWKKFEDQRYCPHCRHILYRVDNRPYDGMAIINGYAAPIEVKMGHTRFTFADLKEHQREGMKEWEDKHDNPSWLFLQIGDDRPNSKSENRRRCWLFTLNTLNGIETLMGNYDMKSLPLNEHTTSRKILKEHELYATNLLKQHELMWKPGGWTIAKLHTFCMTYGINLGEGAEI